MSNIIRMAHDYLLPIEERMMFDWLVVKQEDFGLAGPFRHSIPQVYEATGVKRYVQDKAIKRFVDMGFLTVGQDYYQNNPYRTFYVDFTILSKPEVLQRIVKAGSDTYLAFSEWTAELSKAQVAGQKPLSKTKQKALARQKEMEIESAKRLHGALCEQWRQRILMYNEGQLTKRRPERTKEYSALPIGHNTIGLLCKLLSVYDKNSVANAFVAYADKVLKNELKPKNILLYFLTLKDGDFVVVNEMSNYYTMNYGHDNY